MQKNRVHLYLSGKVQNVFFRAEIQKKAQKLGLAGWVRNTKDGRVEAIFEGERESVEKMINWAKKGPILAKVEDFKLVQENYQGEFNQFEIRYD